MKNLKCLFREVFWENIGENRVVLQQSGPEGQSSEQPQQSRMEGGQSRPDYLESTVDASKAVVAQPQTALDAVAPAIRTEGAKKEGLTLQDFKSTLKTNVGNMFLSLKSGGPGNKQELFSQANTAIDAARNGGAVRDAVKTFADKTGVSLDNDMRAMLDTVDPPKKEAVAAKDDLGTPPLAELRAANAANKFHDLPKAGGHRGESNEEIVGAILKGKKMTVDVKTALNFRKTPNSGENNIQSRLQNGTEVSFVSTEVKNGFVNVKTTSGQEGWVALKYLKWATQRPEDRKAHEMVEQWKKEAADKNRGQV